MLLPRSDRCRAAGRGFVSKTAATGGGHPARCPHQLGFSGENSWALGGPNTILNIFKAARVNGGSNGTPPILGSGLSRRKLTRDQRVDLAVDVLTGIRPYLPSCGEMADAAGVPVAAIRERAKVRNFETSATDISVTAQDPVEDTATEAELIAEAETFASAWLCWSTPQREAALRAMGLDNVLLHIANMLPPPCA